MGVVKKISVHKKNLVLALIVSLTLFFSTIIYAGENLGGNYDWLMLPSGMYGIPEEIEKNLNVEELFHDAPNCGWDGQFYYYISNDLLGLGDTAEHIDAPSYRYQRVGLPLIAKALSLCLLQPMVTVWVYVLANTLLLGLAVYFASNYLNEKGRSSFWILPWVFSAGVVITLRHCLPDGAADALVLMAFLAHLKKKDIWYSVSMTLGCLAREGFILVAFIIFCMRMWKELKNSGASLKRFNYKTFICYAFPGLIFILWYGYVTVHFGAAPFTQAGNIQDWYLSGWATYFTKALTERNLIELCGLLLYFVTVVYTLLYTLWVGKRKHIYWAFVPYIVLVSSFGPTVMMHWSGYLKGISMLFWLLPLMFTECSVNITDLKTFEPYFINKEIICLILAASVVSGILGCTNVLRWVHLSARYSQPLNVSDVSVEPLEDFSCELEILDIEEKRFASNEFMKSFTDDYIAGTARIKNTSNEIWSKDYNADIVNNVRLGYRWFNADDLSAPVLEGRIDFPKNLMPGDELNLEFYIDVPKDAGQYVLRLSLVQEGYAWFDGRPGAQFAEFEYTFTPHVWQAFYG